jgi:hypothetical protein
VLCSVAELLPGPEVLRRRAELRLPVDRRMLQHGLPVRLQTAQLPV